MSDDNYNNKHDDVDEGRRNFLKNTGIFAGGIVGGSILGGFLTNQWLPKQESVEQVETADLQDARVFFERREDFEVLSAATEHILPKDKYGPGAIELGVPYFIDKQLNG